MNHILYQIFKMIWIYHKNHETLTDNIPVKKYVNGTENRVLYKIKTDYCLEI